RRRPFVRLLLLDGGFLLLSGALLLAGAFLFLGGCLVLPAHPPNSGRRQAQTQDRLHGSHCFSLVATRTRVVSSVLGNGRPSTARASTCHVYLLASTRVMTCVAVERLPPGKTPVALMVQRLPSRCHTPSPKVPSASNTHERMRRCSGS